MIIRFCAFIRLADGPRAECLDNVAPFCLIPSLQSETVAPVDVLFPLILLILVAGTIRLVVRRHRRIQAEMTVSSQAVPMGYTHQGQPIYPFVGYTTGGTPVTADQVSGRVLRTPVMTNSKAILTLILAFIFPIAAIPLGHIARGEIDRSGEGGDGLALAGLIISYAWIALVVFAVAALMIGL